jgi:hypothetical protein
MRLLVYVFLLAIQLCTHLHAYAQVVVFAKLPKQMQLFARDSSGMASFELRGTCTNSSYTKLRSVVYQNNQVYQNKITEITAGVFAQTHTIEQGLVSYKLMVYVKNSTDSILVATVDKLLCGDVILIYGQSNAGPQNPNFKLNNPYCRGFGRNLNSADFGKKYNLADSLFGPADDPGLGPGIWANVLMDSLVKKHKVPILAINGSIGGAGIVSLTDRQYGSTTNYDKMLLKTKLAGVQHRIKAIFYRQGESEAEYGPSALDWERYFKKMAALFAEDYGAKTEIFVAQLDITQGSVEEASQMRDFQRRVNTLGERYHSYTLSGTGSFDGVHYGLDGHIQHGKELVSLVSAVFYGEKPNTRNGFSPRIEKVFYINDNKQIKLVFDKGQNIRLEKRILFASPQHELVQYFMAQNFIFDNNYNYLVQDISTQANEIILDVPSDKPQKYLTYLPARFNPIDNYFFPGPFITNSKGMRAFAFYKVPIANALETLKPLELAAVTRNTVTLQWGANSSATAFELYRKAENDNDFGLIEIIPNQNTTIYTDKNVTEGLSYEYLLKATTNTAESNTVQLQVNVPDHSEPQNLAVKTLGESKQALSWTDNATDEGHYVLEISKSQNFANAQLRELPANSTQYLVADLDPNTTYYYRVVAYRPTVGRYTKYSDIASGITCPLGVANFAIKTSDTGQYTAQWNYPTDATIMYLLVLTNDLDKKPVDQYSLNANIRSLTLPKLKDGSKYILTIAAQNSAGCMSVIHKDTLVTPLNMPSQLKAEAKGVASIMLSWADNSETEDQYEIYETSSEPAVLVAKTNPNAVSFLVENLKANTQYKYSIKALNKTVGGTALTTPAEAKTHTITPAELPQSQKVTIGPNPFTDYLEVKFPNLQPNSQLQIFDTQGKKLLHKYITNASTVLDLQQLVPGTYLIQLMHKTYRYTSKIQKSQ